MDFNHTGFEWIDFHDVENSCFVPAARGESEDFVLFVCNFTPVPRERYRIGVPEAGVIARF